MPYGRVLTASGQASLRDLETGTWHAAVAEYSLRPGNTLRTGPDSRLVARFGDGSSIELAAGTDVALGEASKASKRPLRVRVTAGDILAAVQPGGGEFLVETAAATAEVLGTRFAVEATSRKTVLTVLEGSVVLSNDLGQVTAQAMQQSVAVPGHAPTQPHRLVGRVWGGEIWGTVYAVRPTLRWGGGLAIDTADHGLAERESIGRRLRDDPEEEALLLAALGALWAGDGGIRLSVECAREVASRRVPLLQLRPADVGLVLPLSKGAGSRGQPVFHVKADSPAAKAGLQAGDVIVSLDGRPVESEVEVMDALWRAGPGCDVEVTFVRGGEEHAASLVGPPGEPTDQERALLAAVRLLQQRPDHLAARIAVANAQAWAGDEQAAQETFRRLLEDHPNDAVLIHNLGLLAVRQDRLSEAFALFRRATELAPGFEAAWLSLAELYSLVGSRSASLGLKQHLVAEHPDWEATAAELASDYAVRKDLVERIEELRILSQRHAASCVIASCLARALARAGRPEEAEAACQPLLAQGVKGQEARYALAWYLLPEGEGVPLVDEMASYVALSREPWEAVHTALCYRKHGAPEKGLPVLADGLRMDPANARGCAGYLAARLGSLQAELGRPAEALDSYLKAAQLEPEWAASWYGAGHAAAALEQLGQAADYYMTAAEIGLERATSSPDNLATVLWAAREGTRCVDPSDQERRSRFGQLAGEAAQRAEALARAEAPQLWELLGEYEWREQQDGRAMLQAYARSMELDPGADHFPIVFAMGDAAVPADLKPDLAAAVLAAEPSRADQRRLNQVVMFLDAYLCEGGNADRVRAALTPLVERLGDPSYVHCALAAVHLSRGDPEEALRALGSAASGTAPTQAGYWQLLASTEEALGHREEALTAAHKCLEAILPREWSPLTRIEGVIDRLNPDGAAGWWAGAARQPYRYRRQNVAARAGDEAAVAEALAQLGEWWTLVELHLGQGRLEEAEEAAYRGLKACGPGHERYAGARWALARVREAQGRRDEAAAEARAALEASRRGKEWVAEEVFRDGVLLLLRLCEARPTPAQLGDARAGALLALDLLDLGQVGRSSAEGDLIRLVTHLLSAGEVDDQAALADQVLQLPGRALSVRRAQLSALARLGSTAPEAIRLRLKEMAEEKPTSDLPWLGLFALARETDEQAALHAAVEAVRRADPRSFPEMYAEVADFLDRGDVGIYRETLASKLEQVWPNDPGPTLLSVRLAMWAQDDEALAQMVAALQEGRDVGLLRDVALALSSAQRHAQALEVMEHAIRLNPTHWRRVGGGIYAEAWRIFQAAGATNRLLDLFEEQAAKRPEDGATARSTALLWANAGDDAQFRKWLAESERRNGSDPWTNVHWFYVHLGDGNLQEARRYAERAADLLPAGDGNLPTIRRLLDAAEVLGDAFDPADTLCQWVREEAGPTLANQVLATVVDAAAAGRPVSAVAEGLAPLLTDHREQAAGWIRRLAHEYPKNPAVMLTLVKVTRDGRDDEARAAVGRAREALERAGAEPGAGDGPWLALYQLTKATDPEAAQRAALNAVPRATDSADPMVYADIAEFLAAAEPEAGFRAFADRLEQAGGATGPLGVGVLAFPAVGGEPTLLADVVGGLAEGRNADLCARAGDFLSRSGHHEEAMSLMETAIRARPPGVWEWKPEELFGAAGSLPRLLGLLEEQAAGPAPDWRVLYRTIVVSHAVGDPVKCRKWLELSEEAFTLNAWWCPYWAWVHEREGDLAASQAAVDRGLLLAEQGKDEAARAWVDTFRQRIDALGEAREPVGSLCQWIGEELASKAAGQVLSTALDAAAAGRPLTCIAEGLGAIAADEPARVREWMDRLVRQYPRNRAVLLAALALEEELDAREPDQRTNLARASLKLGGDTWAEDVRPCVYVAAAEVLLAEGLRDEALEGFRQALAEPGIGADCKARAERGLGQTQQAP